MKSTNIFIIGFFILVSTLILILSNRYGYGESNGNNYHYVIDKWTGEVYLTTTNRNWINKKAEFRARSLRNEEELNN